MTVLFLVLAVVSEVTATVCLRLASTGRRVWWVGTSVGYGVAFVALSLALAQGLALGVAYGVWAAAGVALTAILSRVLFKEPLTGMMGLGLALIISGVLLIELGAAP